MWLATFHLHLCLSLGSTWLHSQAVFWGQNLLWRLAVTVIRIQDNRYLINTAQLHRHARMVGEDLAAAQLSQQLSARLENW